MKTWGKKKVIYLEIYFIAIARASCLSFFAVIIVKLVVRKESARNFVNEKKPETRLLSRYFTPCISNFI